MIARILARLKIIFSRTQTTSPKPKTSKAKKAGVAGLALTISFVGGWEGVRYATYKDVVGVPTICYGETRGIEMGQTATKAECDAMLRDGLEDFERGVAKCIKPWESLPVKTRVAVVSWAYNVGVHGACTSTAVKRFNAGDLRSACDSMTWWNKGGGRKIPGLVNRRTAEHKLCVADL